MGERVQTAEIVGEALGLSGSTYKRAKVVVEAATDPARTPDERATAAEALADMDAGRESITGAYNRVKDAEQPKPSRTEPGPRRWTVIDGLAQQRRAISSAEAALSGLAHGLGQITELHPDITSEEAARWAGSLFESRRVIAALIKLLRERSNASSTSES